MSTDRELDPDTSTKELIESIIKSHFEDYEWPSPSGGVSSATLCAEQILEALKSAKKDCISKEDAEAAIGEDEDVLAIRAQGENKRAFEAAGKNDLRASIRKNLGLDDK